MNYKDLESIFSRAVTNLNAQVAYGTGDEKQFNESKLQSPLVWLFTPTINRDYTVDNGTFKEVFNIRLRAVYSGKLIDNSDTLTDYFAASKIILDQIIQQIRNTEVLEIANDTVSPLLKIQDQVYTGWEVSFGLVNYQEGDCCELFEELIIPAVPSSSRPRFHIVNATDGQILVYDSDSDYWENETPGTYWTQALFDAAFAAKDTDDLDEGSTNLYYTEARVQAVGDARYLKLAGGTMTGAILMSGGVALDSAVTAGTDTLNLGTTNADAINLGRNGATVILAGTTLAVNLSGVKFLHTTGTGGTGDNIENLFIGPSAGQSFSGASFAHIAIGRRAGQNLTGSVGVTHANTFIGYNVAQNLLNGLYNTAVGGAALSSSRVNTSVDGVTLMGYHAGLASKGVSIVAIGAFALSGDNDGSTHVAIGRASLAANTTGDRNTALGFESLTLVTTGSFNTGLGWRAGDNITTGSNNLIIGYDINAQSATASNQGSIGNLILMDGGFGTGTTIGVGRVGIGGVPVSSKFEVFANSDSGCVNFKSDDGFSYFQATEVAGEKRMAWNNETPIARPLVPLGSTTDTLITALASLGHIRTS